MIGGKSMLNKQNKWFYAFLIAAVLLLGAVIAIVAISAAGGNTDTPPVVNQNPTGEEGPETGVYYYTVEQGDVILSLNGGNKFTIAGPGLNRSGTYTLEAGNMAFTFVQGDDVATAVVGDGIVTVTYNGSVMTFLKQVNYTVTFNTDGGSQIASVQVMNGKQVAMPAIPEKDGYVFTGWYADAACKTAYQFNKAITGDTTIYAGWIMKETGRVEYVAHFDLGYEGAEELADMTTINGKLFGMPTPARDGYTFAGWFISMAEDGQKLTYAYNEDIELTADTTLFAVWAKKEGSKLLAPNVSVTANGIRWNIVDGASAYLVKVLDAQGGVLHEETTGAASMNFDFASRAAGDYTVEVTAIASNTANNSDATVRYFRNKALDRITKFQVINGMLIFNAVENAQNYLITVDCGNPEHNHTRHNNGSSTVYNFANCSMQEGGIRFTVVATANGYMESVPQTFVYERNLAAVENLIYDAAADRFLWDVVENATAYMVTITVGGKTIEINNGTTNYISTAMYSGEMSISVTPVTEGYNTPAAATATHTKTAPAAPQNIRVDNMVITWDAVEGAEKYEVKVGGITYDVTETRLDLIAKKFDASVGQTYQIQVKAIAGAEGSSYSTVVTLYKTMDPVLFYNSNTVYWTPVLGCTNFDVRVNGGDAVRVTNTNSAKVVLTKAGVNVIEVRCADLSSGEWVSISVTAYEVVYNSRTLNGEMREYLAVGDKMMLPQHFTNEGYNFAGWYNAPGAANGNGKLYASNVFTGNGDTALYANWSPKQYNINFVVDGTVTNITNGSFQTVTYTKDFVLTPAITNDDTLGYFVGWYTGPNGTGIPITDSEGNSLQPYGVIGESFVYPYFADSLTYELLADGTYGVKKGPGINNKSVRNLYIPATYQGKPVTQIMDNAFARINNILTVEIPDTVTRIGVAAFERCDNLTSFTVYVADPNSVYEVFYASDNGALLYTDAASGNTYLEIFPAAKTGTYTVPEHVDNIRAYAFQNSNLEKVIISKGVTLVAENAFYSCTKMRTIEFEFDRTETVTIEDGAFVGLYNVETLILPAKLAVISNLKMLDRLSGLKTITVEKGGENYSSLDNLLCDALGTSLLYVPNSFAGVFEVPSGITSIGSNVFAGRKNVTEVIIPAYVNEIGSSAFASCTGLTKLTVEGPRNNDLMIKANAFAYCTDLLEIVFDGGDTAVGGGGKITIGDQAFNGCEELEKLTIGDGVIVPSIGSKAFANCVMLNELNIHDNATLTSIGTYAFQGCNSIKEYVVHASTTNVGNYAFSGCSYLETVAFAPNGKQVTFGSGVFSNCDRLTTIQLPATLAAFDGSVFDGCEHIYNVEVDPNNQHLETYNNALYTKGLTELIYYPRNLDGDMTQLPWDTLTKIGPSVFKGNAKIKNIVIGAKVVAIGDNAFDSCINLESVTFANLNSAMTIGNNAFNGCSSLTSVVLPSGTTTIGNKAFFLTKLTSISLPATVTRIGNMAFAYTDIATVNFPASVTYIGAAAFYGVNELTTVTFEGGKEALTLGGTSASGTNIKNAGVFYGTSLTEVVLPSNISTIGAYVFAELTNLTSVTIPADAQLTSIGNYAFYKCPITSITLPEGLKTIGENVFRGTKLPTVTIPASVENIKAYAFSTNTLTEVLFTAGKNEKGLTIANYAFVGAAFSEITLPAHLKSIGGKDSTYYYQTINLVFYKDSKTTTTTTDLTDNTNLTKIHVAEGGQYYASKDGILYGVTNGVLTTVLYCPKGNSGEIIIPNTVTNVQLSAFCETNVTTVIFEEFEKDDPRYGTGLLTIGDYIGTAGDMPVFGTQSSGKYSKLKLIQFPSHLKAVHSNGIKALNYENNAVKDAVIIFNPDSTVAFEAAAIRNNNAIKVIQMPKMSKTERLCFTQNGALEEVTFAPGSNMTTMGERAFDSCAKLKTITIPASVTMLGYMCFSGCSSLETFYQEEGGKLETIGASAFQGCRSFKVFKVPDSVTVIDSNAFSGCELLYRIELSKNMRNPVPTEGSIGSNCKSLVEIWVPEDHEYLKTVDGVLYDKQMTVLYLYPANKGPMSEPIPDSVQIIEGGAFNGYQGKTIVLPSNLLYIRNGAFQASKLEYITLPKKLRELGKNAFRDSQLLHTVTFEAGSEMELIEERAFNSCYALANINLPDRIQTIEKNTFEGCRALKRIVLPAALRKIATYTFKSSGLVEIVMQEGLVEIETRAFEACKSLKSVTIPDTVTKLGEYVFYNSTALEEVIMTENSMCVEVGQNLFHTCTSLKTVHFGPRISKFGATLFNKCYAMEEVFLPDDLTEVPASLFLNCEYLKRVSIPAKATKIGDSAFQNCVSLESVMIPAAVKTIGQNAFNGCTNLATVEIESGNNMQIISPNAFYNCSALVSINLPQTVVEYGEYSFANTGVTTAPISNATRKIGNYAFYNCKGLTVLSIPSSVTNIGDYAFAGCSNVYSLALATGLRSGPHRECYHSRDRRLHG